MTLPVAGAWRWLRRRWDVALTLLSLAATVPVVLLGRTQFGDLSNNFTDHLHHAYATWIFLQRGLAAYTRPYASFWGSVPYPHVVQHWGHMPPLAYPPGALAVFLPTALLGRYVPLSQALFGKLSVLYLLLLTHLALFAVARLLRAQHGGGRLLVGAVVWLALLRLGLEGFYDPLWIGCGCIVALRLSEGAPASALRWCVAGGMLHFRAAMLAPLGAVALVRALRGRAARDWPWATLLLVAVAGALVVGTFALMYPATAAHRSALGASWLARSAGRAVALALVTVAGSAVMLRWRDGPTAAAMVLAGLLAFVDLNGYIGYWHHASLALVVPLAAGAAARLGERLGRARELALLFSLALSACVWQSHPFELIGLLATKLRVAL